MMSLNRYLVSIVRVQVYMYVLVGEYFVESEEDEDEM